MLGAWAPVAPEPGGMDFAERLALWFSPLDAIGLQAAHRAIEAAAAASRRRTDAAPPAHSLAAEFRRVQGALAQGVDRALAMLADDEAGGANYSRYAQCHAALQRQMEQMIGALRADTRRALGAASPRLRQLALLDAALEPVLAAREQALLPTLSGHLARRYEQLRTGQAPGWHGTFSRDWGEALLAERDLRLAPVAGLVDAMDNELKMQA